MNKTTVVLGYLGWVLLTLATGGIGAVASMDAAQFYGELQRPSWAPPASVFGPVWTTLFVMIGVAAARVWQLRGFATSRRALVLFLVQLVLNALWSWLFFAWKQGALAMVDIVLLWLAIVALILAFRKHSALAAWLLGPYLLWVSFATALCYTIWQLNPAKL